MKGISDVIAVLLMLIITIALAGLAYAYITGVFSSRTSVLFSLDPTSTTCNKSYFHLSIRNDGSSNSGEATISITAPDGKNALSSSCTIGNVPPMSTNTTDCARASGKSAGGYIIKINAAGVPTYTTTYYCRIES